MTLFVPGRRELFFSRKYLPSHPLNGMRFRREFVNNQRLINLGVPSDFPIRSSVMQVAAEVGNYMVLLNKSIRGFHWDNYPYPEELALVRVAREPVDETQEFIELVIMFKLFDKDAWRDGGPEFCQTMQAIHSLGYIPVKEEYPSRISSHLKDVSMTEDELRMWWGKKYSTVEIEITSNS